jgi:hypothetical protein
MTFKPKDVNSTKLKMEALAADMREWFISNNLMANDDKLIVMLINGPHHKPIIFPMLSMGEALVPLSESAVVLGVEMDNSMSMAKQVNRISRACFYQLHRMYKIRKCVTENAAKAMVHSLVTSRLDYCNSLLYGLPDVLLNKLWCVQKAAARLIKESGKYDHITPIIEELHWLPIWERIEFKILLLTYKALHGVAPGYLSELLTLRPDRGSHRDGSQLLVDPKINRVTYGGRAFRKASPVLWNTIPPELRNCATITKFKKDLKTHLCQKAYQS